MEFYSNKFKLILASVFSDETDLFRTPAEPDPGDTVTVRLRILKGTEASVSLLLGQNRQEKPMNLIKTDGCFDWFETDLRCFGAATQFYSFLIRLGGGMICYNRSGAVMVNSIPNPDKEHSFRIIPGFHVPTWAKGATQYQIFPDRFCNGNPDNDVRNGEYQYLGYPVTHANHWDDPLTKNDFCCFYGGDLIGVEAKLDYLQSLGVKALYFNPIFTAPSSHKYDTQDYEHVDPHLAMIVNDGDYGMRTTNEENLKAADKYFEHFCSEVHRRGMKLILDGVFNHCGSFHRWLDKEGLYADADRPGALQSVASPYRDYFSFTGEKYDAWWGMETLPKLNYEKSGKLCDEIFRIAEKWISPPYCIDGWRLDVASDLGHSREFNHLFWKEFRRRVKAINPEVLIVAEHYGDPSEWLCGDEWDTVMNYDAFMDPVSYFLTGMEKHSDSMREDLFQNGSAFFRLMREKMAHLPTPSLQCAMNELSNHDHSRFLTRTNGRVGRLESAGSESASLNILKGVFREAVLIQMTWPGAPTIYYGDEAGLAGWTDPDNRRTFPWGYEDLGLIELHKALSDLRTKYPALKNGSMQPLCSGTGYIAYARFDASGTIIIVCNNLDRMQELSIPLVAAGIEDGARMKKIFFTDDIGFMELCENCGTVKNGMLSIWLDGHHSAILIPE